ncbi:CRP-like cAMP-binding protein [Dyadobacter jejuensis]|uniref:CRP-like cAMP-binding protein n=1 Tax=Dyadobacter jejuensis TaxID=1082580 RepID=A0A316AL10_9BACT|nr:cyclic nucleotide-binding domain-containing protein [Dyadobacter jejuensis]PWJ57939.1 CRP-like cAMP-binding protein [Dyadobacter jejuensis]
MTQPHFLTQIFKETDFTIPELETILPKFQRLELAKGAYMLQEGDLENHYWFLERGYARSYVIDPEGKDISTNFYAAGDIVIDWTSFFLRNPTRENIQTLSACVLWQLDFNSFQDLFHNIKSFREQGRTTLVGSYFELKKHSVSIIADQAKDRYLKLMKEKPDLIQNISLKHIATYLGVTDTSLSRIRKEISE